MAVYTVEYHRVWVVTVEAESREEARRFAQEDMSAEPDAEDYSFSVVKRTVTADSLAAAPGGNVKCENCGLQEPSNPFPLGWTQSGKSKFGGMASYCPTCS